MMRKHKVSTSLVLCNRIHLSITA